MRNPALPRTPRRGFTLVELLVVISLIGVLAALTIAFFPSVQGQAREARAGQELQAWLTQARQKALRNQAPYGLRLWIKEVNDFASADRNTWHLYATDAEFIEQPEPFTGGTLLTPNASNLSDIYLQGVDVTGGNSSPEAYAVQVGDYLEVNSSGLMHRIVPNPSPPPASPSFDSVANRSYLKLNTPLPFAVSGTTNYRILRKPRVTGEEPLKLPDGVAVDLKVNEDLSLIPDQKDRRPLYMENTSGNLPSYVDVLFSPTGAVITSGQSGASVDFWVRAFDVANPLNGYPFGGEPTIVSVATRTGFVGAYPPSQQPPTNPFALVK